MWLTLSSLGLNAVATKDKRESQPDDDYISYGYLDPLEAERLFKHFQREHIRFQFADISRLMTVRAGARLVRSNALELFIHREDVQAANRVLQKNAK